MFELAETSGITAGGGGWTPGGTRYLGGHADSASWLATTRGMSLGRGLTTFAVMYAMVLTLKPGSLSTGRYAGARAVSIGAGTRYATNVAARATFGRASAASVTRISSSRTAIYARTATSRTAVTGQFGRGYASGMTPVLGVAASGRVLLSKTVPRNLKWARGLGHAAGMATGFYIMGRYVKPWIGDTFFGGGDEGEGGSPGHAGRGKGMCHDYAHCL